MPAKPVFHRAPLMAAPFAQLPLGAIQPEGWLLAQLTLQQGAMRDALAGRWRDILDATAWTPPMQADWVRDIALLSAVLPLGYLLEDEALVQAVRRRMQWAMDTQREDGCFLPEGDEDPSWCARATLMQLLQQYYAVTAEKQVLVHMLRYAKYAWERMEEQELEPTAAARAGELLMPVLWLYRATGKRFLLEAARTLQAAAIDWTAFCHTMPLKASMHKQMSWSALQTGMEAEGGDAGQYHTRLYQQAQAVNLAMGLKLPALIAQWTGGIKHAEAFNVGYAKLMRYHGLANGIFSGDDLLSGAMPSQGTVCAAISELMSTLEAQLVAQGEATHGDLLEKLAFNALPAAYSPDMRARQRVQQPNQIVIGAARHAWYSAQSDANAFAPDGASAEDAALHHGFARFAASLWMASEDGGLAAMAYAPCSVRARVGGTTVRITEDTLYPYQGAVKLTIHARQPVRFTLRLRIPDWAVDASAEVRGKDAESIGEKERAIECKPGRFAVIDREWQPGDVVMLDLPMRVVMSRWYHGSGTLMRGPLLLAHAPEKFGETQWPVKRWAYALDPQVGGNVSFDAAQVAAFGHGRPLVVEVKAIALSGWGAKDGDAEAPPIAPAFDPEVDEVVSLSLVPYGGTALRICQFPVV